jgi:vacuolar-type H+-ATPase subunit H
MNGKMNLNEKLEEIDEILASFEDWMHGEDGKRCTEARKLLREAIKHAEKLNGEMLNDGKIRCNSCHKVVDKDYCSYLNCRLSKYK